MAQHFQLHPTHPQLRLIHRAVEIVRDGGVIAYPTDSSYALGCTIGDKQAMERIRSIREVDASHNFTLVCSDLSHISLYAKFDNSIYRLLKVLTPGPYTFILPATREVPRRLQHPRKRTIGIRVPDYPIVDALLDELGEPLMSSTLIFPGDELPENDPLEIRDRLEHDIDLVIDGGPVDNQPTTVVDLTDGAPKIVREGKGAVDLLN
ncbi:MAG: threonylcarbamoyl-AMP synthase [marine bacterium B5-7]|nr:MAG: threonylcarbamoyl-AMP synthase [marine bacterium B5-7]